MIFKLVTFCKKEFVCFSNLPCSAVFVECDQYNHVIVPSMTLCDIALYQLLHLNIHCNFYGNDLCYIRYR